MQFLINSPRYSCVIGRPRITRFHNSNLEHKAVSRLSCLPTPCTRARTHTHTHIHIHTHISSRSLTNIPHCPFFAIVLAVAVCVGERTFVNISSMFLSLFLGLSVTIPSISWTFCHCSTTFQGIPLNLMDLCCGSANLLKPQNPEKLNIGQK